MQNEERKRELIRQILAASAELTKITGRPCTPDGHMVGSIGEVYAETQFGIKLFEPSHPVHDGEWNGRKVQIKTTQSDKVPLSHPYDLLLVLHLNKETAAISVVYNGDGKRPWDALRHKKFNKNGTKYISFKQLKMIAAEVN